jgi:tungstate transport system substrate-binding protein
MAGPRRAVVAAPRRGPRRRPWSLPLTLVLCTIATVACRAGRGELVLASTTSTYDSGLLDVLLPVFEAEHDSIRVKLVAVGSGEALALGRHGDADVLLVHSPAEEAQFMAAGHGVRRLRVMRNDYLIAGPRADPARIADVTAVSDAARRIATAAAGFISRGDSSGTHRREVRMWHEAGVEDAQLRAFRIDVGQGMAETLAIASERRAYTLTDRATFAALQPSLQLVALLHGAPELDNPYSVITARRARHSRRADLFADWITSEKAAAVIRSFRPAGAGSPVFAPATDAAS